jgi:hypothetical protein
MLFTHPNYLDGLKCINRGFFIMILPFLFCGITIDDKNA